MDTLSPGCPPGDLALSFALPPAALSSPARKKRGAAEADFDLPPPPTRSRKIIQMKPKEPPTGAEEKSKSAAKSKESGGGGGGGKKKSTASTAAGRKIARKTAHSLIERRRRSKMNEEFATLKDMIPACRGQDMHKLAILQVCTSALSSFSVLVEATSVLIRVGQHRVHELPRAVRRRSQGREREQAQRRGAA